MNNNSQIIVPKIASFIFVFPTLFYTICAYRRILSKKEEILFSISTTIFLSFFIL